MGGLGDGGHERLLGVNSVSDFSTVTPIRSFVKHAPQPLLLHRSSSSSAAAAPARTTSAGWPSIGRVYWDAAPSQWYAEPKRLAEHGYLEAHKTPGRTRERTHYTLTERGREALAEWVRTPATLPRIQNEPVVRLLAADLVEPEAVLEGLAAMRADLDAALAGVARRRRSAPPSSPTARTSSRSTTATRERLLDAPARSGSRRPKRRASLSDGSSRSSRPPVLKR